LVQEIFLVKRRTRKIGQGPYDTWVVKLELEGNKL
jgi:hypothetical protein